MRWKQPFGVVSIGVGLSLLYAAWAEPPFLQASTACYVPDSPGVHVGTDWTLEYFNSCGSQFEYAPLYFLGFTLVGIALVGGGVGTIRDAVT